MSIHGTLGRSLWLGTVRCLCSTYGPAFIMVGTFAIGGSATFYLDQHSTQAAARTPADQVRDGSSCGFQGSLYVPKTNQFYCEPNGS